MPESAVWTRVIWENFMVKLVAVAGAFWILEKLEAKAIVVSSFQLRRRCLIW